MADIRTLDVEGHQLDVLVSRYIDNELSTDERTAFESRLRAEPRLRARLSQFKHNDALLHAQHQADRSAVPQTVINLLADANNVSTCTTPKKRKAPLALAASLLIAVGAGLLVNSQQTTQPTAADSARVLAHALETLPSRAEGWDTLADGRALRAVLTFPAADGAWCREFMLASDEEHWRGVACRHGDSWVTQMMGRDVFLEREAGYRPAGAADSDAVARFIDATASGIALSASEEQQLIASEWRRAPAQ